MGAKGFDSAQATSALPGVLSARVASGEDLGMVADTITSALNSFGMEASQSTHVADVLATAANATVAGVGICNTLLNMRRVQHSIRHIDGRISGFCWYYVK